MDESFCLFFGEDEDLSTEVDHELSDLNINETQSFNKLPPEVNCCCLQSFCCLLLLFVSLGRRRKYRVQGEFEFNLRLRNSITVEPA